MSRPTCMALRRRWYVAALSHAVPLGARMPLLGKEFQDLDPATSFQVRKLCDMSGEPAG